MKISHLYVFLIAISPALAEEERHLRFIDPPLEQVDPVSGEERYLRFIGPPLEQEVDLVSGEKEDSLSLLGHPEEFHPRKSRHLSHRGSETRERSSIDRSAAESPDTGGYYDEHPIWPERSIGYEEKKNRCFLQFKDKNGDKHKTYIDKDNGTIEEEHEGKAITCRRKYKKGPPDWFIDYLEQVDEALPYEENRDHSSRWYDKDGDKVDVAYARYKWHAKPSQYKLKLIIEKCSQNDPDC